MTYQRNRQITPGQYTKPSTQNNTALPTQLNEQEDNRIRVNGFNQVIEMLKNADREFRDSLIRRLVKQDPKMGKAILQELRSLGLY